MTEDIPERWRPLMERKGIKVSYRGLSERADVSHEAVRRVVRGWSVKPDTIQKVADALGVDREVVNELRGEQPAPDAWAPPQSSSLLSHEERDALSRLISLMVAGRTHDDGRPPTTPAGDSPAQDVIKSSHSKVLDEESEPGPAGSGQQPGQGRRSRRPS